VRFYAGFVFAILFTCTSTGASETGYRFYACVTTTKDYVVGAKLPASGLFFQTSESAWQHLAYNHPFLTAIDYDAADPTVIYLAAGNALIRAADGGKSWRFLTGSDVTELRDVAVDRHAPGTLYFAHSHGVRMSRDRGVTWSEVGGNLHRKYTEALRVDRSRAGVLVAGGEEGIFRSEDSGGHWSIAGAAGFAITRIDQSPHDPCEWLAATEGGGVFASHDCARTFESAGRVGVGRRLYDVAFDLNDAKRIAVAGWDPGIVVSEDGGRSWQARNTGLPRLSVISVAFDPGRPGRMYAGVNEEGLYVSDDWGGHWRSAGMEGTAITRMKFVPMAAGK
jgi:photosystem II stability/assembly factor-like uncharacterized protein